MLTIQKLARLQIQRHVIMAGHDAALARLALRRVSRELAATRREGGQLLFQYREECPTGKFEPWLRQIRMAKSTALRWIELVHPRPNPETYEFRGQSLVIGFNQDEFAALQALLNQIQKLDPDFHLADCLTHALSDALNIADQELIQPAWNHPIEAYKRRNLIAGHPEWHFQ